MRRLAVPCLLYGSLFPMQRHADIKAALLCTPVTKMRAVKENVKPG